ncbi:MAG TPA: hypothetical protein VJY62_16710 [Bacteroidia bacterium]|nr:hypothetical protein [Bacteroidia bacterium]
MKETAAHSEMKTLVSTLNSLVQKGYTEDYKVNDTGLKAIKKGKIYQPDQVKIVDFHRFEGTSDPADESILYVIETNDGSKGTLVDAFGPSSDTKVTAFIKNVEEISKKVSVK